MLLCQPGPAHLSTCTSANLTARQPSLPRANLPPCVPTLHPFPCKPDTVSSSNCQPYSLSICCCINLRLCQPSCIFLLLTCFVANTIMCHNAICSTDGVTNYVIVKLPICRIALVSTCYSVKLLCMKLIVSQPFSESNYMLYFLIFCQPIFF